MEFTKIYQTVYYWRTEHKNTIEDDPLVIQNGQTPA